MKNYLFVHFRETLTPDGEQVYFSISRDGLHWEALNNGAPVLWAYQGDCGVRDMTIVRDRRTGKYHIFATDLSLAIGMRGKYDHSWRNIATGGSKALAHWESDDLVHWTEEELVTLGDETFGCLWAPDVIYDREHDDYLLHWSSSRSMDDFNSKQIYYSRTKDFVTFSKPQLLYERTDGDVIDSAMYEEDGRYYLFVKGENNPCRVFLTVGDHADGPFTRIAAFDESTAAEQDGWYEAPTAVRLDDGRWCLFLDHYGTHWTEQGYVPFIAPSLKSGAFVRSDSEFSFPYNFKHGTILQITEEDFDRMKARDWTDIPDGRNMRMN